MAIARKLPTTNIGRRQTLNKAHNKVINSPSGGNILSATTTTRLAAATLAYNNGAAAITTAIRAQRNAIILAKPQRILLRSICKSYVESLDNGIKQKVFPLADRAFFGLDISNTKLPDLGTDEKLQTFAALVIVGDAERVAEGGKAMSLPTIGEFTAIYDVANPIVTAISNTKTNLTTAKTDLNKQNTEINDCIVHVWGEAEANFSLYAAPAKRAACRPWSVRYISKGDPSVVTGKITNSLTGLGLPGVSVRITGSGHSFLTDAEGNFSINTSMYGDLELIATHLHYIEGGVSFEKENGVPFIQNLALVAE